MEKIIRIISDMVVRRILVYIVALTLWLGACGGEIHMVPVTPGTENAPSTDDGTTDDGSDVEDDDTTDSGSTDDGADDDATNDDNTVGGEGTDDENPVAGVEISNWNFEEGLAGWSTKNYKDATQTTVEIVEGVGVNGSKCVKIHQTATNSVCCMAVERTLTGLEPETMYRMTAQVKYENVVKGCGAVIFNHDELQYWNSSEYLLGTSMDEWTTAVVDFLTDENGSAKICCALGYWLGGKQDGGRSTGTVYYDNVRVVKVTNQLYIRSGEHMGIYIDPAQIEVPDASIEAWLEKVDGMYEAYAELVGDTPYDGRRLGILTTKGIDKGYLALAGLPILWNGTKNYQKESFAAIHEYGSMDFGMMHEMGHTFNHVGESSWNWNDEMFANFRMQYGLEKTGYGVYAKGCKDVSSKMYYGRDILNMYKQDYEATINSSGGINDNGIHYILGRMAGDDCLKWTTFQKAFRYLHRYGYSGGGNKWAKFQNFVNTLSRFTVETLGSNVDAWSYITEEEQASIKKSLDK